MEAKDICWGERNGRKGLLHLVMHYQVVVHRDLKVRSLVEAKDIGYRSEKDGGGL